MTKQSPSSSAGAARRYFPAVEGMRGVAVMLVFAGHVLIISHPQGGSAENLGHWLGATGLIVFFVISGFLLYRPFLRARGERRTGEIVPRYLLRRAVRILPAYWVALTLSEIWFDLTGVFNSEWWVSYGLLQSYDSQWQETGLGVAWTLCVEATFYLALPLIALLLQNRGLGSARGRASQLRWELGFLGAMALAGFAWLDSIGPAFDLDFIVQTLPATMQWFAIGMFLAVLQISAGSLLPRVASALADARVAWAIAAGVFLFLVSEVSHHVGLPEEAIRWIEGLGLLTVAVGAMGPTVLGDGAALVRRVVANRVLLYLGTISYGIYLYHLPIVYHLNFESVVADSRFQMVNLAVIAFVACFVLGTASWYLIERPLMRLVRSVKGSADIARVSTTSPPPTP